MREKIENLILVSHKSGLERAYELYDSISFPTGRALILTDYAVEADKGRRLARNLSYYQELFDIKFRDMKQSTYNLLYSLSESKVCGGPTLRELTKYKGVSLWDLSAQYLYSELMPLLYYTQIIDKILEYEEPQRVYVIGSDSILGEVFFLLCKVKMVNFIVDARPRRHFLALIKKLFNKYSMFLKRVKRLCLSSYFFMSNLLNSRKLNKKYKLIFFAPTERFLFSMIPLIKKYSPSQRLVINDYLSGSSATLRKNKISYTDFYGYSFYNLFSVRASIFLKIIKKAIFAEEREFFKNILYNGLPIGGLLECAFEKAIFAEIHDRMREVDSARKIFSSYMPEVVVVGGASFKITLIAKSLSIPVVAIQSIHPSDFIFFAPISADAVTVDGNFWKEYLVKRNVDSDKIFITGSMKYDFLREIPVLETNSAIRIKEKTVVFATNYSSLAMGSLKFQNMARLKSVCGAMKNINEAGLIIKLHPYDNDFTTYANVVRNIGLNNCKIIKDADTFRLLQECDLLITHISAVSYEAVLMNKPVILLCGGSDFQNEDAWDFRRYGVAIFVDDLSKLEYFIRKVLFDAAAVSELASRRMDYIEEHVHGIDGNAAVRTKELIDKYIYA